MSSKMLAVARVVSATGVVLLALGCSNSAPLDETAGGLKPGSPGVPVNGQCPWMDAQLSPSQRAQMLVGAMSLDQKIQMLHQATETQSSHPGTAGYIPAQPELCIPAVTMNDAGAGVGNTQKNTVAFPVGIAQASSWDISRMHELGKALGWQAWHKGTNVQLAPTAEITRVAVNGRNFEYFGEDPYLVGHGAAAVVNGIQSNSVIATVKHWLANVQEQNRNTVSSDMDERTMREIYAAPYETIIRLARPGSIMCSYNRINGVYSCEDSELVSGLLRQKLGFDGFVMSDWGATHSTVQSALAGLDIEMGSSNYYDSQLKAAVESGQVPEAQIDGMVERITSTMFRIGLFDRPAPGSAEGDAADVSRPEDIELARKVSEDGTVLLKNQDALLPLIESGQKIAVIGIPGGPLGSQTYYHGGGSSRVPNKLPVMPFQTISERAKAQGSTVEYATGALQIDGVLAASRADIAIVFAGAVDSESQDRSDMTLGSGNCQFYFACIPSLFDQDALIEAVADANPNTIVVLNTGGPIEMRWLPKVKSVLQAWYPGQEGAYAIARLLFGDVAPSAKLPMTFPKTLADTPAAQSPEQYPGVNDQNGIPRSAFSERLLVGYRWYDAKNIAPLFPFGYGLSYTTFTMRDLSLTNASDSDAVLKASFTVVNTGARGGAEVPQLYVASPADTGEPPKQLKGFTKAFLEAGESRRITIDLDGRAFAHWNEQAAAWKATAGCYGILVGSSSRDLPLSATVSVNGAACPGQVASLHIVD